MTVIDAFDIDFSGRPLSPSAYIKSGVGETDVAYIKAGAGEISAAIGIDKSATLREVRPGGTILYTIMVTNTSGNAYTNLVVSDTYDTSKVTITNASQGSMDGNVIRWTIPSIAPGDRWVVRYSARAGAALANGTTINNTSVVDGEPIHSIPLSRRSDSVQVVVVTELPKTGFEFEEEWFDPAELQSGPKFLGPKSNSSLPGAFGTGFLSTTLAASAFLAQRRRLLLDIGFATLSRLV